MRVCRHHFKSNREFEKNYRQMYNQSIDCEACGKESDTMAIIDLPKILIGEERFSSLSFLELNPSSNEGEK